MRRKIYEQLKRWKESPRRKPLVIQGARQVGKSWILKEFGKNEYDNMVYISFDNAPLGASLFSDYDIPRIIRGLEAISHQRILPGKTFIVLDEIQEIPAGLGALKYFCEEHPEYHVAVAGSLLGITLHQGTSFPVGKVNFLKMYPMDFEEFLWALNEDFSAELLRKHDEAVVSGLHEKYVELLRQYYFVGGMPEAIGTYVQTKSVIETRDVQKAILEAYRNDISKHAPLKEIERIQLVLRTLPAQLAKENKKFVYSAVRKGARAAEFETAIQWLVDAGIVYRINRVSRPGLPLRAYEDFNAFKLYLLDCGLFGAMADTDPADVLVDTKLFSEYKGAFTESYVIQQLLTDSAENVFYYSAENSRMEIDAIISIGSSVYPIEVKAEVNLNGKSLKLFAEKFSLPLQVRYSMRPYKRQESIVNLPLYTAAFFCDWIRL